MLFAVHTLKQTEYRRLFRCSHEIKTRDIESRFPYAKSGRQSFRRSNLRYSRHSVVTPNRQLVAGEGYGVVSRQCRLGSGRVKCCALRSAGITSDLRFASSLWDKKRVSEGK